LRGGRGWGLADEDGVDIFIVVADPGAGLAADGRAVIWLALAEIVNALHIGAGVAVEELFEERFAGDFGDADVFYLSCDLGGGFLRTEGEGKERESQGCADRHVQLLYANEGFGFVLTRQ